VVVVRSWRVRRQAEPQSSLGKKTNSYNAVGKHSKQPRGKTAKWGTGEGRAGGVPKEREGAAIDMFARSGKWRGPEKKKGLLLITLETYTIILRSTDTLGPRQ